MANKPQDKNRNTCSLEKKRYWF